MVLLPFKDIKKADNNKKGSHIAVTAIGWR